MDEAWLMLRPAGELGSRDPRCHRWLQDMQRRISGILELGLGRCLGIGRCLGMYVCMYNH